MTETKLKDLTNLMKERGTVNAILQAKDVKVAYQEEKAALGSEIRKFADLAKSLYAYDEYAITEPDTVICKNYALEVFFVMIMGRLDAHILFADQGKELERVLRYEVFDAYKPVATNCYKYLARHCITEHTEEELLEEIFFK